jgi:uncharacterized protein YjiS (DUF1127 family)
MSDFLMTRCTPVGPTARRLIVRPLFRSLRIAFRTYLTRQALPELTPRELADIGVSPSTALAEAARLPWDFDPEPRPRKPGIIHAIGHVLERARSRRLISRLELRELRDFGVSPSDAQAEATKWFWRV